MQIRKIDFLLFGNAQTKSKPEQKSEEVPVTNTPSPVNSPKPVDDIAWIGKRSETKKLDIIA